MPAYEVQRSIVIDAPAEEVFETVADFNTWMAWSPWLSADKGAKVNVSRDSRSVGSVYEWLGDIVGQGEIEHKRLDPPRQIDQELRFVKPFRSRSRVAFALEHAGDGTKLTWQMRGSLPWFLFWMRSQIKVYIGLDYERGLRMLKELIETGSVLSNTDILGVQSIGPLQVLGVRAACAMDELGLAMERAFGRVESLFAEHGLPRTADAASVYQRFDFKSRQCEFTSGFVVPQSSSPPAPLVGCSIPAMRALAVRHTGSYQHLGNAWSAAYQYARYKKLKLSKLHALEIYRTGPHDTAPADLITHVFLPVK